MSRSKNDAEEFTHPVKDPLGLEKVGAVKGITFSAIVTVQPETHPLEPSNDTDTVGRRLNKNTLNEGGTLD